MGSTFEGGHEKLRETSQALALLANCREVVGMLPGNRVSEAGQGRPGRVLTLKCGGLEFRPLRWCILGRLSAAGATFATAAATSCPVFCHP